MKKAILTLALAAVASSSMSGFVYGPVFASTNSKAPLAVQSEIAKKTFTAAEVQAKGEQLANAGDWAGLVKFTDEVIAANPNLPEGYFFRALGTFSSTGDVKSVMADLSKAIELNPKYVDALSGRAIVATIEKDFQSAVIDWSSVLAIQPENLYALENRMNLHATLQDLDGLEQDYTHWISVDPENPDAYYYRAMLRAHRGDIANAISDLEKTSELLVAFGVPDEDVQTLIAKLKNGEAIG